MGVTPDEIARIKRYEGDNNHLAVNHFYLDTNGYVTIGWGHKTPSTDSAVGLPLVHKTDLKAALDTEKRNEWTKIKSEAKGYKAAYYDQFCSLQIAAIDIEALLTSDLSSVDHQLSTVLSIYNSAPQTAKAGLFDMVYTLGMTGLLTKFPNFIAAVKKLDWATAAKECNRPDVSVARNTEVKQLFLQAVTPKPTAGPKPPTSGGTGTTAGTHSFVKPQQVILYNKPAVNHLLQQPITDTKILIPGYNNANGIVAMVAMVTNVTTAAITAITALAANSKKTLVNINK